MANITNADNIPTATRAEISELVAAIGPNVLGDNWPEGVDASSMTKTQMAQIFELITREFWRQQLVAYKADMAAQEIRNSILSAESSDPFS